jgi:hypothetical protein
MIKKRPPFSKNLLSLIQNGNKPEFVAISVGADCFNRAVMFQSLPSQCWGISIPDGEDSANYDLPVSNSIVIIDWNMGISKDQIKDLIIQCFLSNALMVIVRPSFIHFAEDSVVFSHDSTLTDRFIQTRETIVSYKRNGNDISAQ